MTDACESLKTSVSNGKSTIASAITDKGISTSSTAEFSTMASNIRSIPTGATLDPITADITFTQAVYASWAIPMNFKLEYYDTNLVLRTLNATLNTIGGTVTERFTFAYKTYIHFYSYGGSFSSIKAISGTIAKVYRLRTTGDNSYDYDFYIVCT